jgi:hypothetical protein
MRPNSVSVNSPVCPANRCTVSFCRSFSVTIAHSKSPGPSRSS